MGSAFNNGVDVAKRTSNFSHWFICFATVFVLYFLLANYLRNRKFEGEDQKAVRLLDNVIILANLILGLRCITYFADESSESNIFYYSDFIIAAIIFLAVSYILFGLKNKISVERFEAIIVAGLMIALPISIAITHDWALGRGFMGVQVIAAILITSLIRLLRIDWNADELGKITSTFAMSFSLIPFCTSPVYRIYCLAKSARVFCYASETVLFPCSYCWNNCFCGSCVDFYKTESRNQKLENVCLSGIDIWIRVLMAANTNFCRKNC